jgi:hypothetical protein
MEEVRFWPVLRDHSRVCLEGPRKATENRAANRPETSLIRSRSAASGSRVCMNNLEGDLVSIYS